MTEQSPERVEVSNPPPGQQPVNRLKLAALLALTLGAQLSAGTVLGVGFAKVFAPVDGRNCAAVDETPQARQLLLADTLQQVHEGMVRASVEQLDHPVGPDGPSREEVLLAEVSPSSPDYLPYAVVKQHAEDSVELVSNGAGAIRTPLRCIDKWLKNTAAAIPAEADAYNGARRVISDETIRMSDERASEGQYAAADWGYGRDMVAAAEALSLLGEGATVEEYYGPLPDHLRDAASSAAHAGRRLQGFLYDQMLNQTSGEYTFPLPHAEMRAEVPDRPTEASSTGSTPITFATASAGFVGPASTVVKGASSYGSASAQRATAGMPDRPKVPTIRC